MYPDIIFIGLGVYIDMDQYQIEDATGVLFPNRIDLCYTCATLSCYRTNIGFK